jgi:UDP-glucose:(heptosyl)LPS alpha-1,3-glucosyltransferase
VHRASLEYNARRFAPGLRRSLYRLGKVANPRFWTYQAIERRQYDPNRQARAVAVSNMVRGHLQLYHRIPSSRITVIPNAIDADRLQVAQPGAIRCAFRNSAGLEPDDLVGLFVGHNYWLKGLMPLLTALARRKADFPAERPVHLLVSGAGKAAPILRMVRRLGLEGTVHVAGFIPDIRACYWSSDFFVSPTYYDPCSLAVLEALACGLPAITTACNGAGELMTNGREGYVIPAPDALDELTGAIEAMTDDEERRRMAGHAARLGRSHTFDHHVSQLVRIFEEVAAARTHRGPHAAIAVSRTKSGSRQE